MTLLELQSVLQPPQYPQNAIADPVKWQQIEAQLGSVLPDDYKSYIGIYGTGSVANFIRVFNPFSPYIGYTLFDNVTLKLKMLREFREEFPDDFSGAVFPEMGGILPFADTDNGDWLFWETEGDPNTWTIVIAASRAMPSERYALSMTSFLAKLIGGAADPEDDILQNTDVFPKTIDRQAKFLQPPPVTQSLSEVHKRFEDRAVAGENNVSKAEVKTILLASGLILEHEEVQQQLEGWQNEKFIELVRDEAVYLRLLI